MSIEGPKKASGGADNGGAEGLTEEQKQKAAEEKAKADAAKTDSDIQNGLNGKKDGASQASGAGSAGGGGNTTIGGAGVQGSGGFGYGGIFGNTSLNVDQEQLNDLTNKFFNFTMNCGSLPFGIGTQAMQNSFGAWFQAIMNCFQFTNTTNNVAGGNNFTIGGQTVVSGGGETRLADRSTVAADNGAGQAGASPAADGDDQSGTRPAGGGDEQAGTRPAGGGRQQGAVQPKYVKYGNGNLLKVEGDNNRYVLKDGEYVKVDSWGKNGEYVIAGVRYNKDGNVIKPKTAGASNTVGSPAKLGDNMQKGIDALVSKQFSKSDLTSIVDSNPALYQVDSSKTDAEGNTTIVVKITKNGAPSMSSRYSHEYTMTFDKAGRPTTIKGGTLDTGKVFEIKYGENGNRSEMTQKPTTYSYTTNYGQKWTYNEDGSQRSYEKYHMASGWSSTYKEIDESSTTSKYAAEQSQLKAKMPVFSSETSGYSNVNGKVKITQGDHVWTKSGDKFVKTNSKTGEVTTFDKDGNRIEYYNPGSGHKTSYTADSYTVRYNKEWKK